MQLLGLEMKTVQMIMRFWAYVISCKKSSSAPWIMHLNLEDIETSGLETSKPLKGVAHVVWDAMS